MSLNFKHHLFVHYYLNDAKDDEVLAAKLAGFANPETAGMRLLGLPKITSHLAKKMEEAGVMSTAEILARLTTIAGFDPTEFLDFNEETNKSGNTVEKVSFDVKKLKRKGLGYLIKELKIQPSGHVEIKFQDSIEALDKVAKYHGLFKERIEISHINADPHSERIVAILGGLAELARAVKPGESGSVDEPRALCDSGEQWEVEASPAPEIDQPTLALGGPEGD